MVEATVHTQVQILFARLSKPLLNKVFTNSVHSQQVRAIEKILRKNQGLRSGLSISFLLKRDVYTQ